MMLAFMFVWPWWVTIGGVLVAAAGVGLALALDEDWYAGAGFAIGGLLVLFFGAFALTVTIGRHYDRINCRRFEQTTGRPTRYVIYSIGSTACLTRSGKTWLPIEQVREFGNG